MENRQLADDLRQQDLINNLNNCNNDNNLATNSSNSSSSNNLYDTLSSSATSALNNVTKKAKEDDLCKICMDSLIDCVLLECAHMVSCTKCGKRLAECPICRQNVVRVVRVFKP